MKTQYAYQYNLVRGAENTPWREKHFFFEITWTDGRKNLGCDGRGRGRFSLILGAKHRNTSMVISECFARDACEKRFRVVK